MRSVKIKIRNLAVLFFSLFLTLAVFSQISAANPKPTYDVGLNKADWLYYKTNNDLSAYLGKKSSNLPTVRYQKSADYLEFSMTGVSSTTSVSLETDVKTPNTPILFYRNIFDGADANYQITNIPFRVKEEIALKETFPTSLVGKRADLKFLFSAETSAKPVKQKDGSIVFFDDKGDYLFQLDKPFMVDAKGTISNDVDIEIVPTTQNEKLKTQNHNSKLKTFNKISNNESLISNQITNPNNQLLKEFKNFFNLWDFKNWNLFKNYNLEIINSRNIRQNRHRKSVLGKYQIILTADSAWLNNPSRAYPVIIDPTVTHNADANFTGQMNRIADSDTTSSTKLESSYPEATLDPYTVMLLPFNEANGTTAGIKDYASTTRVITANGNASTTNAVTQLGLGNSAAFDGNDELSMPNSSDFNLGRNDFTLQSWVYLTAAISGTDYLMHMGGNTSDWAFTIDATSGLGFRHYNNPSWNNYYVSWSPSVNTWYNLTITRSGNTLYYYVNGSLIGTNSFSATIADHDLLMHIGDYSNGAGNGIVGYLDSLRVLKGRALTPEEIKAAASRRPYAVYTSSVLDATASVLWNTVNWTEGGVNTGDGEQPYSANSLVAQWDFNDTSGTTLTASSSGSCTTSCNGTLTNFAYTASQDQATTTTGWTANNKKWGAGALMMESAAAADYVSITDPASNVLDPNSADLTIETWIKTSDTSAEIFSNNNANGTACTSNGYYLGIDANGYPVFYLDTNGATAGCDASTTSQFKINDGNWHKVSVSATRGTSAIIYVDGKSAGSDTSVTSYSAITVTGNAFFGGSAGGLDAILDSARYYSRALSAAEVLSNYQAGNIEIQTRTGATSDPNDGSWEAWKPTTGETQLLSMDSDAGNWNAPQQIDGYTKLLLHMDGTDTATTFPNSATTTHTVTATGNAQVDTAQSKFRGASGLFDGTGDYLSVPDSNDWNFGTGLFTIDAWIRFNTVPSGGNTGANLFTQAVNDSAFNFLGYNGETAQLTFRSVNATYDTYFSANWSPVVNRWYHIALVRVGTSGTSVDWKYFVDGVGLTTVGYSSNNSGDILDQSTSVTLGGRPTMTHAHYLNGWIDEFRISKGIARWTSNFTPPPRPYGSNVKAENETTIKQEGTGSAKLTLGAPQIDGNTVALWHFEETGTTTGTFLYDETANNNDATTTGTTVVDGIFGKARSFDGVDDNLTTGNTSTFKFLHGAEDTTGFKWSADFWVKMNAFSDYEAFFGTGPLSSGSVGTTVYVESTRTLTIYISYGVGGQNIISATAGTYPNDTSGWHHIAFTYDQSLANSNFKAYIDGALSGSGNKSGNTPSTANSNSALYVGATNGAGSAPGQFLNGSLDEFRITKGRALSADEIAEAYRMGANHHLTRQVSATDLSAQTKLAFNVAADRPGTYLEAMLGESDYANYELASSTLALSTTTVLYIKGDEIASSTSIKDSSFSGKAITANGNARTAGGGKIGNSVYFDGTGDYLSVPASSDWGFGSGDFAIDMWVYPTSNPNAITGVMGLGASGSDSFIYTKHSASSGNMQASMRDTGGVTYIKTTTPISLNVWQHIALVRNGNNLNFYLNSNLIGSADVTGKTMVANSSALAIGLDDVVGVWPFSGYIDEVRVIKGSALSADQIRQAYEYGLRSHQITIDFGATLQSADLISSATDYNFSLTATTSGLSATTSGLYLGDTIIVKENVGGTESVAQGVVKYINSSTGAVTVASWSGSVPSGGFTVNATVFKWQKEYFDLTGAATTTRDAITNLTLRPTNGAEGRTIYLDDFRYNTNYLTASSSSAITSSNNRYLQYRTIFSSWDSFVSPYLSAISAVYSSTANMFAPIIGISGGGFLSF